LNRKVGNYAYNAKRPSPSGSGDGGKTSRGEKMASQAHCMGSDKVVQSGLHPLQGSGLISIKRAGADLILTYFAKEAAKILGSR